MSIDTIDKRLQEWEGRLDEEGSAEKIESLLRETGFFAYQTRLKIYELLVRCPTYVFSDPHSEDVQRLSKYILSHKTGVERSDLLRVHVLYCCVRPDEPQEQLEAQAITLAENILKDDTSTHREQLWAHLLLLHRLPEDREHGWVNHRAHLSELFRDGDPHLITLGCFAAPPLFHADTKYTYLDQAVDQLPSTFETKLLRKKMVSLMSGLLDIDDGDEKEKEWFINNEDTLFEMYTDLMDFGRLHDLVYAELGLAVLVARRTYAFDLAFGHCSVAMTLAKRVGGAQLERDVQSVGTYLEDMHEVVRDRRKERDREEEDT